jgi:hypothetical protein
MTHAIVADILDSLEYNNAMGAQFSFLLRKIWRVLPFALRRKFHDHELFLRLIDLLLKRKPRHSLRMTQDLSNFLTSKLPLVLILGDSRLSHFENQRSIQVAREISKRGNKVIFVHWEWTEVSTFSPFLSDSNLLHLSMNDHEALDLIRNREERTIFLVNLPTPAFFSIVLYLKQSNDIILYDIMDNWEGFFSVGQAPWYIPEVEIEFVQISDFVTAVTQPLIDKFQNYRLRAITLVENGTLEIFNVKEQESKVVPLNGELKLIYAGSLEPGWIDHRLFWEILRSNERIQLQIAGNTDSIRVPKLLKERVRLLGWKTPAELMNLYANSNLGLAPFKTNSVSDGVNPIKIYDYQGSSLPTILFGLPHQSHQNGTFYFTGVHEFANWIQSNHEIEVQFGPFRGWKKCADELLSLMGIES